VSAPTKTAQPKGMRTRSFELIQVDPRTLVLDPCNVRDEDVQPTQEMLESVAQDGVDTPVIIRPLTKEQAEKLAEPGKPLPEYGVLAGQQRWLSNIAAANKGEEDHTDWFALPCVLRTDLKGADQIAITRSLVENTHRKAMSKENEVRAAAQLSAFKMTPTQRTKAARSIGLTPEQFKAAKHVATMDQQAFRKASENDFDLVQAMDYDEVKDVPGALEKLLNAMKRDAADGTGYGQWQHALAELKQKQAALQERAKMIEALDAAGVTRIERQYEWKGTPRRPLADLINGLEKAIDPERHNEDCPGRAYYLEYGDVVFACADWKKNGHRISTKAAARDGLPAATEEASAERKRVIDNNQRYKAATIVRQAAQKAALKEKTSDAAWALIRRIAWQMPDWYAKFATAPDRVLMAQLLGAPESMKDASGWLEQAVARMGAASSGKLQLAQIFAAYEARVMKANKVWDKPDQTDVELLIFMRDHLGYTLADIEAEMVAYVEEAQKAKEPTASAVQPLPGEDEAEDGGTQPEDGGGEVDAADEASADAAAPAPQVPEAEDGKPHSVLVAA